MLDQEFHFDTPNFVLDRTRRNRSVVHDKALPMRIYARSLLVLWLLMATAVPLVAEEPKRLIGHTDPAYAGVYSPDGSRLVTASFDKTLRIWDLESGTTLRTLSGHTGLVLCVAISPDGSRLASGSLDKTVRLWDMPLSKPTSVFQPHQGAAFLAASPDGLQWLTGGADRMLRLWNPANLQKIKEIGPLPHPIVRVALRADKNQIAAADTAGFVRLFNPADGASQGVWGADTAEITGLAYAPNGAWIMTTGAGGLFKRWPTQAQPTRSAAGHEQPILALRVSPDNSLVATGSADNSCRLWNNANQQPVRNLEGHGGPVTAIAFQNDGRRLVTGCGDKIARLFDVASGALVKAYPEQAAAITAVAIHPNNLEVAVADASGTIKIWTAAEGTEVRTVAGHAGGTFALTYATNPLQLISGGADKRLRIWTADDATPTRDLDAGDVVRAVAVSSDHRQVAAGCDDKMIRVWNLGDGSPLGTFSGHTDKITSLDYCRDNIILLSSSLDGTVRGWNTTAGKPTQHAIAAGGGAIHGAGWSSDNQTFVFAGEDQRVAWDSHIIQQVQAVDDKRVNALAVSPNSSHYFTAGDDGIVKQWDISNGNLVRDFRGHEGPVLTIAVGANQQQLASGGRDKRIKIWNLTDPSKPQYDITTPAEVVQLAFSPDQKKLIAAGNDQVIRGFDPTPPNPVPATPSSQEPVQVTDGLAAAITGLVFAPDNRLAISAAADGAVRVWTIASAQSTLALPGHQSQVYGVSFHPTLPLIASGSNDKTVKIWDYEKNQQVRSFAAQGEPIYALTFTPDGTHVITAGGDKTVRLYQVADGAEVRQYSGAQDAVYSVAVSPNGRQIAAAGLSRKVLVWNLDNPSPQKTLAGHKDDIYKVEFNRSGNRILSVGYAGNVAIWNPNQDQPLLQQKLPAIIYSGSYAPSGQQVALFANDGQIYLLDVPADAQ